MQLLQENLKYRSECDRLRKQLQRLDKPSADRRKTLAADKENSGPQASDTGPLKSSNKLKKR